jgi:protein-S-isoprenylcysteine O-methyltransferase Ste14
MRKALAIVGSAIFLVIAPGFFAGLAPWWLSHWRVEAPFFGMQLFRFIGAMLVTLGAVGLLDSFSRFALQDVGTPAPIFPTRHLVVTGLYRYVRNPMYVTVVMTIIGQGLILGNLRLLAYAGLLWLPAHLFVLVYEEPALRASFGLEYKSYCAEVPRWIPRFTPWRNHPERDLRSNRLRD